MGTSASTHWQEKLLSGQMRWWGQLSSGGGATTARLRLNGGGSLGGVPTRFSFISGFWASPDHRSAPTGFLIYKVGWLYEQLRCGGGKRVGLKVLKVLVVV